MLMQALDSLQHREILNNNNVQDLRRYIQKKYPSYTAESCARIFAASIHKIIDQNILQFTNDHRKSIKNLLLSDVISKNEFSIHAGDILKASISVPIDTSDYMEQITDWVNQYDGISLDQKEIAQFVINSRKKIQDENKAEEVEILKASNQIVTINDILNPAECEQWSIKESFIDKLLSQVHVFFESIHSALNLRKLKTYGLLSSGLLLLALMFYICIPHLSGIYTLSTASDKAAFTQNDITTETLPTDRKTTAKKIKAMATAYDLSYESCGKYPSHPGYGLTFSGTKAAIGRTIAVDPKVIPLGSKVYITFPTRYKHLNGEYIAEDTGNLINGNKIDIFMGEDAPGKTTINQKAKAFGIQEVIVEILH